jgi:Phage tail assembly chaperone protein
MNYCLIENNSIVDGPRGLPRSWRNISGLNWLDDASLKQLGWLPSRVDEGIVDEKFVGSTFTILENEVVETKQWRKFTDEERADIESQKAKEVRTDRNKRLAESDWTQLADAPVNVAQWSVYRQALRDVPEQAGFPFTVNWPVQPE